MSTWTLEKAHRENTKYTVVLSPKIRASMGAAPDTLVNDLLGVGKNMWKRNPHVMQKRQTLRKGYSGKIATVQF